MRKINLALGAFFGSIRFVVADCGKLDTLFPGKVFFESSETYDASVSSYFSLQGRLTPTCILRPEKPEDVALAVKTLAEDRLAHFAIRSGGHSPYRGFSNINDGVTIDLRSMNDVCLSKDRKIVRVQSGAIWGEVYPLLEKSGLSAVGGRAGTVGVGGFLTGGALFPTHDIISSLLLNNAQEELLLTREGGGGDVTAFPISKSFWHPEKLSTPTQGRTETCSRH